MNTDTQRHIQPYQYFTLPGQRVQIVNPSGAKLTLHKSEIEWKLNRGGAELREMSAHERIMFETALSVLGTKS